MDALKSTKRSKREIFEYFMPHKLWKAPNEVFFMCERIFKRKLPPEYNIIDYNALKIDYNPNIFYANEIHYNRVKSIIMDFSRGYSRKLKFG